MEVILKLLPFFVIMSAFALFFAFMGYKIYNGNWGHLVQLGGYNFDPVGASKNYDVDSLFRRTGRICFAAAACSIAMAVYWVIGHGLLGVAAIVSAPLIWGIAEVYCMNKYDRVRP